MFIENIFHCYVGNNSKFHMPNLYGMTISHFHSNVVNDRRVLHVSPAKLQQCSYSATHDGMLAYSPATSSLRGHLDIFNRDCCVIYRIHAY